jgi:3-isopropylmalate/(R)-2-methylmalate dehydratase small subunit
MDKFTKLTGVAAPLPLINVDTDMIIPKQFLKTIQRSGLGKNLFDEMRYDDDGDEIADFVLNQPAYRNAEILVAGENFGCGSSREHAPWALLDFGIRCVIAPSFADIFFNNCFKNGILPIVLPQEDVDKLMDDAERGANAVVTVDLESQTITGPDGGSIGFEVDAFRKHCLLNGLDDIGLTMERPPPSTRSRHRRRRPAPGSNPLPRLGNLLMQMQHTKRPNPAAVDKSAACRLRGSRTWADLWQKSGAVCHLSRSFNAILDRMGHSAD